jgi:hypothetical protein
MSNKAPATVEAVRRAMDAFLTLLAKAVADRLVRAHETEAHPSSSSSDPQADTGWLGRGLCPGSFAILHTKLRRPFGVPEPGRERSPQLRRQPQRRLIVTGEAIAFVRFRWRVVTQRLKSARTSGPISRRRGRPVPPKACLESRPLRAARHAKSCPIGCALRVVSELESFVCYTTHSAPGRWGPRRLVHLKRSQKHVIIE